jgi:hypothetical protein
LEPIEIRIGIFIGVGCLVETSDADRSRLENPNKKMMVDSDRILMTGGKTMKINKALSATVSLALVTISLVLPVSAQQFTEKVGLRVEREIHHRLVMLPFYSLFDNLTSETKTSELIS